MSTFVPSSVRAAVQDPKNAPESELIRAVNFYDDELHPDDVQACAEVLISRGGDPDFYLGTVPAYDL